MATEIAESGRNERLKCKSLVTISVSELYVPKFDSAGGHDICNAELVCSAMPNAIPLQRLLH